MKQVIHQLMSMKEARKFSVIKELIDGYITVKEAAEFLSISERWVIALKKRVLENGPSGLIHGNRGRSPVNIVPEVTIEYIKSLYQNKYAGFNVSHFTEMLKDQEGINISRETVRKILLSSGLISRANKSKHRCRRERMPKEGMLIQMDTSIHDWFGQGESCCLIAAIDDATSKVLYASFSHRDTTIANMKAIKEIVSSKGIPIAFYVDRASHFFTTRHGGTHVNIKEEQEDTQIQRACKEIGINIIGALSPQAKGRIERLFETFQDRLVNELKIYNIHSIEDGNKFLKEIFIPRHNDKFSVEPEINEPAYRQVLPGSDLNTIFCIKDTRKVMSDNTISYEGRSFQIFPSRDRISYVRAEVEVQEWIDESIHLYYDGQELKIKEVEPKKGAKKVDPEIELELLRKEGKEDLLLVSSY